MKQPSKVVSIHPYFKAHPGKLAQCKVTLRALVQKTAVEKQCLYYDFTMNGDEFFCREAYVGAAGALTHVQSVGGLIGELLKTADLTRIEVHGPAGELKKLKRPLANLKPVWFVYKFGISR